MYLFITTIHVSTNFASTNQKPPSVLKVDCAQEYELSLRQKETGRRAWDLYRAITTPSVHNFGTGAQVMGLLYVGYGYPDDTSELLARAIEDESSASVLGFRV